MARRVALLAAAVVVVGACGAAPLESIGWRSSNWINEPKISTTSTTEPSVSALIPVTGLQWSNDSIVNNSLDDPQAMIAEVFARREGDRFIQASREEIALALPDVSFPATVPAGARWISSQLVIENSGELSESPSAAFGIWSAEPYTRSRSVAQMAVLRVFIDPVTAEEVELPDTEISCARFADRTTQQCAIVTLGERHIWRLTAPTGTTLVWFGAPYRYELYGRPNVPPTVLEEMAAAVLPLADLVATPS
ncbi:MAG: hypothetical protein R3258_01120 [Acidimicrobiia bacterium]|nr:hypothetical protein [Acidimicrobiia bacterium]